MSEAADPPTGLSRIQAAQAANARILSQKVPDATYASEWTKFRDWIHERWQEFDIDEPAPFLTRLNVDTYSTVEVVKRDGDQNTIRKIVNALTWFATHCEHVGKTFSVDSPDVTSAIMVQQKNYMDNVNGNTSDKCPHRFCKDTMPI